MIKLLQVFAKIMKMKRSACLPKHKPLVLSDSDSDSHTLDTLSSVAEQPDEALFQEKSDKKKRRAKQVMSAEREDDSINWITETPYLYQKGHREYRDTQKRSRPCSEKADEIFLKFKHY